MNDLKIINDFVKSEKLYEKYNQNFIISEDGRDVYEIDYNIAEKIKIGEILLEYQYAPNNEGPQFSIYRIIKQKIIDGNNNILLIVEEEEFGSI